MITRMDVEILDDSTIFVRYSKDGKAFRASFGEWFPFINWLEDHVIEQKEENKNV
jgi:hypothetical protein